MALQVADLQASFFFQCLFIVEREREWCSEREREREIGSEAGSSRQPNMGLKLTPHEMVT